MMRLFFFLASWLLAMTAQESAAATGISEPALFARLGEKAWHRVRAQDTSGVTLSEKARTFDQVWAVDFQDAAYSKEKTLRRSWDSLLMPLPDPEMVSYGYALTYPGHRKEADLNRSVIFLKRSRAIKMSAPIRGRPYLDYELEIGILINRDTPKRFGYVLVNDLTDRGIQVRQYNRKDLAPGFSESKSFKGAHRIGPLLAIGDAAVWPSLKATLRLNGEIRQQLEPANCILNPSVIYEKLVSSDPGARRILVSTGTPAGVIFRAPNLWQKIGLMAGRGFSTKRAKEAWLKRFTFLKAGDEIEIESPLLGYAKSRVIE